MRIALRLGMSLVAASLFAGAAMAADARPCRPARRLARLCAAKDVSFSFEGPFGTYDRAALQRGFQVYKEVCSACHSLNRVAFHALADPGGPGFTEAQAKAIAAGYKIPAGPNKEGQLFDANGERLTRPGIVADHFPPPFAERRSGAHRQWRRAAARSVADRQVAAKAARHGSIRS